MTARLPLLLCMALSACATNPATGLIDYQSSGGIDGGGDGSELHVDVDRAARRVTRNRGSQTTTLDLATFSALRAAIDTAEFTTLEPMYSCRSCADTYIDLVSVQLADTTYAVSADTYADVPPRLQALIVKVHDVIQQPLGWH